MERCYLVNKEDVKKAHKEMEEFQEKASAVSDESTDWELEVADHCHGIAQGYLNCLRALNLIEEPMTTKVLNRQLDISEKIRELQEKELPGTAIPEELHLINISREF